MESLDLLLEDGLQVAVVVQLYKVPVPVMVEQVVVVMEEHKMVVLQD
tara:strand:- start:136 stop:276 length:141 start_codon:yes stop_codon:yes gene_type:complete